MLFSTEMPVACDFTSWPEAASNLTARCADARQEESDRTMDAGSMMICWICVS
jgi:hypothetical protein